MTIDTVKKELLKIGGDRCTVSVSLHRFATQDDDHRSESETWSGLIRMPLDDGETVRAIVNDARDGNVLIRKLKVELREAIHRHVFARKHRTLAAPRQAIGATYRLEHHQ